MLNAANYIQKLCILIIIKKKLINSIKLNNM